METIEIKSPASSHEVNKIIWNGEVVWTSDQEQYLPLRKMQFVVEAGGKPELDLTFMHRAKKNERP